MKHIWSAALAALTVGVAAAQPALAQSAPANEGSAYVQCDGNPNNVTGGETAARLLGAVTLLGVFAKPHEAADGSKRKLGEAGVAACSTLIEGATREGNVARRIPLILGRALHRIEAQQNEAAIADVKLARDEAQAAGFLADPYYVRSEGRSFDQIEGAALLRMGRYAEARDALLRAAAARPQALAAMITIPDFNEFVREPSPGEIEYLNRVARTDVIFAAFAATRFEELGRFADAAALREALIDFDVAGTPDSQTSLVFAQAAVTHMLAGNRELAAKRAAEARANFDKRTAEGKPESNAAAFVEEMDLYSLLETAAGGDVKGARRLFAARSQWVSPSFGVVVETNRRLREGASADELIGGLAGDPDAMWKKRADAKRAQMAEQDKNNRTLFGLIEPIERGASVQLASKDVWRTDKDKMLIKLKPDPKRTSKLEGMYLLYQPLNVTTEAFRMHAALVARARGHQGFVITNYIRDNIILGQIMTGSRGAPGLPDVVFNDANEVITELAPVFPDPAIKPAK